MKKRLIELLKKINCYHPLQWRYRQVVFFIHRSLSRLRYRKQRGYGLYCIFCHQQHQHFIASHPLPQDAPALQNHDVVAGYGADIICPYCFSNARERMVRLLVEEHCNPAGKKILHFSPEPVIFRWLSGIATVTTADLHIGFYKHIDKKVEVQDITAMSYADDSFDLVMANHVLEHVPDDVCAMKEIFRVLKPGGDVVLQVPIGFSLSQIVEAPQIDDGAKQSALFGQCDHVRIYTLDGYLERLRLAGFEVSYHFPGRESNGKGNGLQEREPFFRITKPRA